MEMHETELRSSKRQVWNPAVNAPVAFITHVATALQSASAKFSETFKRGVERRIALGKAQA